MASSTLVSKSSCNVIFSAFSTPNISRYSEEPERGRATLGMVIDKSLALVAWKFISTSGLEGYRETLVKSGISKWAAHPIVNSKRQNLLVNPLMPGGNKKDTHT